MKNDPRVKISFEPVESDESEHPRELVSRPDLKPVVTPSVVKLYLPDVCSWLHLEPLAQL